MADFKDERQQIKVLEGLYSQKKYIEIEDLAQTISKDYPSSFHIKFLRSKALKELNRFNEAESILKDLLKQYPENITILLDLGQICVKRKKIDEAREIYNKVLFLDPFNSSAREHIIKVNESQKELIPEHKESPNIPKKFIELEIIKPITETKKFKSDEVFQSKKEAIADSNFEFAKNNLSQREKLSDLKVKEENLFNIAIKKSDNNNTEEPKELFASKANKIDDFFEEMELEKTVKTDSSTVRKNENIISQPLKLEKIQKIKTEEKNEPSMDEIRLAFSDHMQQEIKEFEDLENLNQQLLNESKDFFPSTLGLNDQKSEAIQTKTSHLEKQDQFDISLELMDAEENRFETEEAENSPYSMKSADPEPLTAEDIKEIKKMEGTDPNVKNAFSAFKFDEEEGKADPFLLVDEKKSVSKSDIFQQEINEVNDIEKLVTETTLSLSENFAVFPIIPEVENRSISEEKTEALPEIKKKIITNNFSAEQIRIKTDINIAAPRVKKEKVNTDDGFITESAAEVYFSQKLYIEARDIYAKLFEIEPQEKYVNKLKIIKQKIVIQKQIQVLNNLLGIIQQKGV